MQSRTGADGTCFRACLASILDLREDDVPDFTDEDFLGQANKFLAGHGLSYRRVPMYKKPVGWSTIEGVSPRGGLHACVAHDGELIWDPHPIEDGTGQGLVEPRYYGLLESIEDTRKADDRADLAELRRNTEKQGGPFFMQETTESGKERTIPIKKLRRY